MRWLNNMCIYIIIPLQLSIVSSEKYFLQSFLKIQNKSIRTVNETMRGTMSSLAPGLSGNKVSQSIFAENLFGVHRTCKTSFPNFMPIKSMKDTMLTDGFSGLPLMIFFGANY
jgi:hypothetical protein